MITLNIELRDQEQYESAYEHFFELSRGPVEVHITCASDLNNLGITKSSNTDGVFLEIAFSGCFSV